MDSLEEALMVGKAGLGWEPLDPSDFLVLFFVCQCRFIHNECLCFCVGQLCCGIIFL